MKATLEFDDGFDFRCAVSGKAMFFLLWDLRMEMRNALKYNNHPCHELPEDGMGYSDIAHCAAVAATEHWQKRFIELAGDHCVDLEDV